MNKHITLAAILMATGTLSHAMDNQKPSDAKKALHKIQQLLGQKKKQQPSILDHVERVTDEPRNNRVNPHNYPLAHVQPNTVGGVPVPLRSVGIVNDDPFGEISVIEGDDWVPFEQRFGAAATSSNTSTSSTSEASVIEHSNNNAPEPALTLDQRVEQSVALLSPEKKAELEKRIQKINTELREKENSGKVVFSRFTSNPPRTITYNHQPTPRTTSTQRTQDQINGLVRDSLDNLEIKKLAQDAYRNAEEACRNAKRKKTKQQN